MSTAEPTDENIERRRVVTPVFALLLISVIMNGLGMIGLGYLVWTKDADSRALVLSVNCNTREAIEDALQQIADRYGDDDFSISIRCLDPDKETP